MSRLQFKTLSRTWPAAAVTCGRCGVAKSKYLRGEMESFHEWNDKKLICIGFFIIWFDFTISLSSFYLNLIRFNLKFQSFGMKIKWKFTKCNHSWVHAKYWEVFIPSSQMPINLYEILKKFLKAMWRLPRVLECLPLAALCCDREYLRKEKRREKKLFPY